MVNLGLAFKISEGLPDFYVIHNFEHPEKMNYADENLTRTLRENEKVQLPYVYIN